MGCSWVETSGTLTNTTATLAANLKRREVIISNNSDTVMTVSIGGTATAAVGTAIPAGTAIRYGQNVGSHGNTCPNAALSLFCAGTAKAYTFQEC